MKNVTSCLYQEISFYGYRANLGRTLAVATALAIVTAYALKRIWKPSSDPLPLSEERFWQMVESVPTIAKEEGPIVIQGRTIFPTLAVAKKQMSLSCNSQSEYVKTYLIQSALKGTVLDLGCGIGANSISLFQQGWKVIAIDNQPEVIKSYSHNVNQSFFFGVTFNDMPQTITGDIVNIEYPKNVDAVICVDVLSYIPPAHLKTTMDKIFRALRPGGKFVGTLFFRSNSEKSPFLELMGKMGAHFYPGKEFAREIVTRSGFQIKKERERIDGTLSHCLEFLAEKPS